MPETLVARSALRAHVAPSSSPAGEPGARLAERAGLALYSIAALKGREQELANALREGFGLELPQPGKRVAQDGLALMSAGPGKWLAAASAPNAALEALPAAVVDQSDGRTVLSLSGPHAREILSTLVTIDLHPRAFGADDVAITHAASIGVTVWRTDDAPTFELAVFRSYAATLWRWISRSGASRRLAAGGGD